MIPLRSLPMLAVSLSAVAFVGWLAVHNVHRDSLFIDTARPIASASAAAPAPTPDSASRAS